MEQKLYTIAEAAELLRVTRITINNWIKQGLIGCVKLGGRTLLMADEIDELIYSNYRKGGNNA